MLPPEIMAMLDEEAEHEKLGACGCTDYHMADCPTRGGGASLYADDYEDDEEWDAYRGE